MPRQQVTIQVVCGDVLHHRADVLALKFAQYSYGVDKIATTLLQQRGVDVERRLPDVGKTLLVESKGATAAAHVLFVGVPPLGIFDYADIREFARRTLKVLAADLPESRDVVMTLHGRGFGLDEAEAFKAEIAGILDAISSHDYPPRLRSISILELDEQTASRLTLLLAFLIPSDDDVITVDVRSNRPAAAAQHALRDVGDQSRAKPHVFVAMPFAPELDDRFHYGIRGAVNAAGYLCERADLASFTGDVIAWVRDRIESASLVIADLSMANPNVYLEVGYAWGRGVRTVLIASSASELKFDVRGQRCLVFTSIRHLEELLTHELQALG